MAKLGTKTAKHNFITIYLREKNKPIFEKFLELIKDDEEMTQLADKKSPNNIISVSVVQALHQYNQRRIAKLRAEQPNK